MMITPDESGNPIIVVCRPRRYTGAVGRLRFTPYAFRHTAATQALASGADVRAVQALLGHTDLRTTTGYLHTTDERNRGAAQKVADFGKAMVPKV